MGNITNALMTKLKQTKSQNWNKKKNKVRVILHNTNGKKVDTNTYCSMWFILVPDGTTQPNLYQRIFLFLLMIQLTKL